MNIDFESRIEVRLDLMQLTLDRILAIIDKPKAVRKPKDLPYSSSFETWWSLYPKGHKKGKQECLKIWVSKDLANHKEVLIADIRNRVENDGHWVQGFGIPNPKTFLNNSRWRDDITPIKVAIESLPRNDSDLERWAVEKGYPAPGRAVTYRQYREQLTRIHNEPGDQP
jgi:hypothetical protein